MMFIKRIVTLLAALALCAGPSVAAPSGFAIARAPYVFVFPRDHGAHDDYQTEWWYFTGTCARKRAASSVTS